MLGLERSINLSFKNRGTCIKILLRKMKGRMFRLEEYEIKISYHLNKIDF